MVAVVNPVSFEVSDGVDRFIVGVPSELRSQTAWYEPSAGLQRDVEQGRVIGQPVDVDGLPALQSRGSFRQGNRRDDFRFDQAVFLRGPFHAILRAFRRLSGEIGPCRANSTPRSGFDNSRNDVPERVTFRPDPDHL